MAKLRCFFGLSHGRWVSTNTPDTLVEIDGPFGDRYRCVPLTIAPHPPNGPGQCPVTTKYVLVVQNKMPEDVLKWLFDYDPDHPKSLDAKNHPRNQAKQRTAIMTAHDKGISTVDTYERLNAEDGAYEEADARADRED